MGYNPYYPYFTNQQYNAYPQAPNMPMQPPMQGMPQMQQPMQQPIQQNIPQQPTQNIQTQQAMPNKIDAYRATDAEATAYIVEPNSQKVFFLTDKSQVVVKTADINGFSSIERYDLTKSINPTAEQKTGEIDTKEFVKREDIKNFVTEDKLKDILSGFSSDFTKQLEEIKKSNKKESK